MLSRSSAPEPLAFTSQFLLEDKHLPHLPWVSVGRAVSALLCFPLRVL